MRDENVIEIDAEGSQEKQASDQNERHQKAVLSYGDGSSAVRRRARGIRHPLSPLCQRAIQMHVSAVHEKVLARDVATTSPTVRYCVGFAPKPTPAGKRSQLLKLNLPDCRFFIHSARCGVQRWRRAAFSTRPSILASSAR